MKIKEVLHDLYHQVIHIGSKIIKDQDKNTTQILKNIMKVKIWEPTIFTEEETLLVTMNNTQENLSHS